MSFEQADLQRRVANLIRMGTVEEADYAAARVRIRFAQAVTHWLPWTTQRAGQDRSWWAPEVGEQVVVLAPSGDLAQGVVCFSIYQAAHPAPADSPDVTRRVYADKALEEYDRAAHRKHTKIPGDIVSEASGSITMEAGDAITLTAGGKISLFAPLVELEAGLVRLIAPVVSGGRNKEAFSMQVHGPITQTGGDFVNQGNDVKASGISLTTHTHGCREGGTGGPQ